MFVQIRNAGTPTDGQCGAPSHQGVRMDRHRIAGAGLGRGLHQDQKGLSEIIFALALILLYLLGYGTPILECAKTKQCEASLFIYRPYTVRPHA